MWALSKQFFVHGGVEKNGMQSLDKVNGFIYCKING